MSNDGVPEWWYLGPSVKAKVRELCMACGEPKSEHNHEELAGGCKRNNTMTETTTATAGRELPGVKIDEHAPIKRCSVCPAEIWFGFTANGRRNPFDVIDGQRTAITHWSTCKNVRAFEKGRA